MITIKKLTKKQSEFLRLILEGKNQLEAYRNSYDTKGKDSSLRVKASKLFNSEKIQEEYQKSIIRLQNKALYTREQAVRDLTFLIDKSKEDIESAGIKQANVLGLCKAIEQVSNILCLSDIETKKLSLEQDKLEFAKSKIKKDNENLEKEKITLLGELISSRKVNNE